LLFPALVVLSTLSEDPVKDNGIRESYDEQEGGADGRPDNSANFSNATDLVSDIGADSDGDVYNYYDSAMAE
jgi:hypothetical protein